MRVSTCSDGCPISPNIAQTRLGQAEEYARLCGGDKKTPKSLVTRPFGDDKRLGIIALSYRRVPSPGRAKSCREAALII
jgi:hypothetical protein